MPTKTTCTDYALYYIHRFPKTEKELILQLIKKWYATQDVDQTIAWLKFKHYIDDRNFAKLYIQSELIKKGKPLLVIKQNYTKNESKKKFVSDLLQHYHQDIQEWMEHNLAKKLNNTKKNDLMACRLYKNWWESDTNIVTFHNMFAWETVMMTKMIDETMCFAFTNKFTTSMSSSYQLCQWALITALSILTSHQLKTHKQLRQVLTYHIDEHCITYDDAYQLDH
jgi:SOS response regulatory protein OraA/RecX